MTTVTTTSVAVTTAGHNSLALIVTIALIALLVLKDLLDGRDGQIARRTSRALNIGIFPLITVFALDVLVRAMALL